MKYKMLCLTVAFGLAGCATEPADPIPMSAATGTMVACGTPSQLVADADRNGRISRDEAAQDDRLGAAFDRYDADKDDQLEQGEVAQLDERLERAEFARMEEVTASDTAVDCYTDY